MSTNLAIILEAILLTANEPMSLDQLASFFAPEEQITKAQLREALTELALQIAERSYELIETASGYRLQTRKVYSYWVSQHTAEKNTKYSRAFLETLALIAWRQPITRGEIEEIRGVAVNANIIKTLLERDWVRVLGHKEVPGRPELLGTTKVFLDYFNLKSLEDLPAVAELKELTI